MYELKSSIEHAGLLTVTMPINGTSFSRRKIEGDLGQYPQQTSKNEVVVEECLY